MTLAGFDADRVTDHVRHNREFWDADADDVPGRARRRARRRARSRGARTASRSRSCRSSATSRGRDVLELGCGAGAVVDRARGERRTCRRPRPVHAVSSRTPARLRPTLAARAGERRAAAVRGRSLRRRLLRPRRAELLRSGGDRSRSAARVLRPGGLLAFCATHPLLYLTWDAEKQRQTRKLQINYDDLGAHASSTTARSTGRCRPASGSACSARNGFEVEDLVELCAGPTHRRPTTSSRRRSGRDAGPRNGSGASVCADLVSGART